ncbi:hypothetical protein F8M41_004330 [Gigaspora margarita]|uniref:Uncharacterized protein n=1 Tax=Gigaspora margarita TaxID=4874 RepID=A0A8H4A7R2_GIGMA|nr:hypothetical protein F8M41_004330 [Gigaspora margarita]
MPKGQKKYQRQFTRNAKGPEVPKTIYRQNTEEQKKYHDNSPTRRNTTRQLPKKHWINSKKEKKGTKEIPQDNSSANAKEPKEIPQGNLPAKRQRTKEIPQDKSPEMPKDQKKY